MNIDDIQTLILVGGRGTRLKPYTNEIPKPLLTINNKPLLHYILKEVRSLGIKDVVFVIDYKKELIQQTFRDSVDYLYNPYGTMIDGVFLGAQNTTKKFLLGLSGDTLLTRKSLEYAINMFKEKNPDALLLLSCLPQKSQKKWKYINKGDNLEDLIIQNELSDYERSGLVMKYEAIKKVASLEYPFKVPEEYTKFSTGWNLLLKMMIDRDMKIKIYFNDFPVFNVNTIEDYQKAEEFVKIHLDR